MNAKQAELSYAKEGISDATNNAPGHEEAVQEPRRCPSSALQRAVDLMLQTKAEIARENFADHACVTTSSSSESATTLGINYDEKCAQVVGLLVGGPAFNSGMVNMGDTIVGIDGK